MDTHVTKEVIERALRLSTEAEIAGSTAQSLVYFDAKGLHQKIVHPVTGRSKIVSEKWLAGGRLERWVPADQVENLTSGHHGAWRVRFKPQFSFERDCVVYMSNNEAVASRKREMPDEATRLLGVLKAAHSLKDLGEAGKSSSASTRRSYKKSRKCTKCGKMTVVELTDVTTNKSLGKQGSRKSLTAQKSYGEMTRREKKKFKKKSANLNRRIGYRDKFIATVVTCLYLLYPTLTRSTFKLVACQTVGCNRYLQMDLDLECWDEVHIPWVILLFIPALTLYVLGLPLGAFYFLHKHRFNLDDKIPRFHFGILYLGFRPECYYWEVLTAFRKTTIICVAVFLTAAGTEVQALLGSFINLVALLLHMNFRPYVRVTEDHDTLQSAEMWALVVSFTTLWMGLFFFQESVSNDKPFTLFLTVVLLIANTVYVLVAFRWFLIIKLVDLEARDEELAREGMDRKKGEIGWYMERALKRLVPEWYHYNSATKTKSSVTSGQVNTSAIERKLTMVTWKCVCGQMNHASHDDPCEKCGKVECECDHRLLELHPLDKISIMSRLSGSLNNETTAQTSSDSKDKVRNSIANMKHDEILSALPHLKSRGAGHYYDGRGETESEPRTDEKRSSKSLENWMSHLDMDNGEAGKKSSAANPDEVAVDVKPGDEKAESSSSGLARRLSSKVAASLVKSGLGL